MKIRTCRERGSLRWWLIRDPEGKYITLARGQLAWSTKLGGIWFGYSYRDEPEWHGSVAVMPLYASLAINAPKWTRPKADREIKLSFHDRAAWWSLWCDPWSWSSKTPRWRHGSWHPIDTLLGRQNCQTRTIEERNVLVPMPEKAYEATAKLVEYTWKRPRSPFAKTMLRCEIEVPNGIPFEGKGENAWDCGQDATFGITTGECKSIPEGVGILVGSVLRSRVKNGGWGDWSWHKEPVQ